MTFNSYQFLINSTSLVESRHFLMNVSLKENILIDTWKEEINSNGGKKVFRLEKKFEKRGYISFVNITVPCLWLCVLDNAE